MNMLTDSRADPFENLRSTHEHEEKLRAQSMELIEKTPNLRMRLIAVEHALALIFAYTHDHQARNNDELTLQYLGIRLFNAGASAIKLALSGYYQNGFALARDILETGFLLDYFRTFPEKVQEWRNASEADRRKLFSPLRVRESLDERDGNSEKTRAKAYGTLSEYASHATCRGFKMTA